MKLLLILLACVVPWLVNATAYAGVEAADRSSSMTTTREGLSAVNRSAAERRFRIPRGIVVEVKVQEGGDMPRGMSNLMVSTGDRLVPFDSEEGREIACEIAVNTGGPGCQIKHR